MSGYALRIQEIACDADGCGATYMTNDVADDLGRVRNAAEADDWACDEAKNDDFCPKHAPPEADGDK